VSRPTTFGPVAARPAVESAAMGPTLVLRNVRPYGEDAVDIAIRDGLIAAIEVTGSITGDFDDDIDGTGAIVLPGLVDLHTHLREPGREDAETVESGSAAAALGGYTAVFAMPNTNPVADTAGVVEQVWRLGRQTGLVDVAPIGAVSVGRAGTQLAELGAMADCAAQVRVFSDDGSCVADPVLMRRALEYVKAFGGVIAQHAEEPRLTAGAQMNEGEVSARLGLAGWPAAAEEAIIARDVLLAGHVGSRLHICHVSTAGSVEILRWAKSKGWQVTAEVTPHHLLLTDDLVESYDPVFKVNPPLRTQTDVDALRAGLADGTIDCVATDHAPHAVEDKETEWGAASPGMLGLQTALSVVVETMLSDRRPGTGGPGAGGPGAGGLDWRGIADRMSVAPARIGARADHGQPIAVGAPANLVVVDPSARWTVSSSELASRSRNTPFAGRTLPARVVATVLRGRVTALHGQVRPVGTLAGAR
jgi:dihydroorotase